MVAVSAADLVPPVLTFLHLPIQLKIHQHQLHFFALYPPNSALLPESLLDDAAAVTPMTLRGFPSTSVQEDGEQDWFQLGL